MTDCHQKLFDVAVVGGGPGGSTIAALLARAGRKVALIEKDSHPKFHIGESLLPQNLPILERLGVEKKIKQIGVHKIGAEFVWPDQKDRQIYLFSEAIDPTPDHAYQVLRSNFDKILFDNAQESGAFIFGNQEVTNFERRGPDWCLTLSRHDNKSSIWARYLVDATGRDGLVARSLNLRRKNREHNSAALFAHFENVSPTAWSIPGNIAIYLFEHGWIWLIPLPDGVTSVGAVCMPDYLKSRHMPLERFYEQTLQTAPKVWECLKDARRMSPVRAAGNYSYTSPKPFGEGYLLLGDAYAFIDPVFSTGVMLAMASAERAAPIIDKYIENPALTDRLFKHYWRDLDRAISRASWFIYRFNTPNMQRLFQGPRNILGIKSAIMSILSGDLYRTGFFDLRLLPFKVIYELTHRAYRKMDAETLNRMKALPSITLPENESSEKV